MSKADVAQFLQFLPIIKFFLENVKQGKKKKKTPLENESFQLRPPGDANVE